MTDPDLKDLIPGYIENRHKDLRAIKEAYVKKDLKTIAALAHKIKGTAATYGFHELGNAAKTLEETVKQLDAQSRAQQIKEALNAFEVQVNLLKRPEK